MGANSFHEEDVLLARQIHERLCLRSVDSETLFAEDCFPSFERSLRIREVMRMGRSDVDDVDVLQARCQPLAGRP